MFRPIFNVDFNEMVDSNTVLLSASDTKSDVLGEVVQLYEGMFVSLFMNDFDEYGNIDDLIATGVVIKNTMLGWGSHVKWCCRIDDNGIRAQSEVGR